MLVDEGIDKYGFYRMKFYYFGKDWTKRHKEDWKQGPHLDIGMTEGLTIITGDMDQSYTHDVDRCEDFDEAFRKQVRKEIREMNGL